VNRHRTYPSYRRGGRFFGRRVNCEYVPILPAGVVRVALDDPRKIPYLLIWKSESDGQVKEAVRLAPYSEPGPWEWTRWVEIKRPDGSHTVVRTQERVLPRNGAKALLLICPDCTKLCRALYGWAPAGQYTTSVQRAHWRCRSCAALRYASEGGALVHRGRGAIAQLFEMYEGPCRSDRPERWYPHVFSSPEDAAAAGFCKMNGGC
jgi:hypothetical protein